MSRPAVDPALGLDLVPRRTLRSRPGKVSVIIPAHNEESTVAVVVRDCQHALKLLEVEGEVVVSASGCTDDTVGQAERAGARVIHAPLGKGCAVSAGVHGTDGDIICLVDGDMQYFGDRPLAAILVEPILRGITDAAIADLYWRPLYPQMWLHAFFAPLCGFLYPELLPKAGSTPWSGQRAARRHLWPEDLPQGFTVDLELLLYWNRHAVRFRPVLADDWTNPQRPKDDLMESELRVLLRHGVTDQRVDVADTTAVHRWFESAHRLMAEYRPGTDSPIGFERHLLEASASDLRRCLKEWKG